MIDLTHEILFEDENIFILSVKNGNIEVCGQPMMYAKSHDLTTNELIENIILYYESQIESE